MYKASVSLTIIGLILLSLFSCNGDSESTYSRKMLGLFEKGNQQLKEQNYQLAERYYSEGIKLDSSFAAIFNNRGIALFNLHRYEEAVEDYNRAIKIEPDSSNAYFNRANAWFELKKYEASLKDLSKIIEMYPDSAYLYFTRARSAMELKRYNEAISDLNKVAEAEPNNAAVYDSRGYLHLLNQNIEQAEKDLQKAVSLDKDKEYDLARSNLGVIAWLRKQPQKAADYFEQALAIRELEPYTLNYKARLLIEEGQREAAKKIIDLVLKMNQEDAFALTNLGFYYLEQKNIDKALEKLQAAQKVDAQIIGLSYALGKVYWELGERQKSYDKWQNIHDKYKGKLSDEQLAGLKQ